MKRNKIENLWKENGIFSGRRVFRAVLLLVCLTVVGGYAGIDRVNAATTDDTSTSEDVQIGEDYWTESRGNIIYSNEDQSVSFYTEDIRQLGLALQEAEQMAENQGIYNPDDVDENGNPRRYTATAGDVLEGKTFFNANRVNNEGVLEPGNDTGTMGNYAGTAKEVILTRDQITEQGTVQEEGYAAAAYVRIPESGYYDTDSELKFSLADINRHYYKLGNTDGYEQGYTDAYNLYLPDLTVRFGMEGDDGEGNEGGGSNWNYARLEMTVPEGYTKLNLYFKSHGGTGKAPHSWTISGCGLDVSETYSSGSNKVYSLNYSGTSSISIRIKYHYSYACPYAVFSR